MPHLNAVLFHPFLCLALLVQRMYLYLIHHGFDTSKAAQINEAVRIKIGHANGSNLACLI